MGISHRARRAEEEAGTVSICSPRREDRLLRTFRRFAARLFRTAGCSKWIVPFAGPHLQYGGGGWPGGEGGGGRGQVSGDALLQTLSQFLGRGVLRGLFL